MRMRKDYIDSCIFLAHLFNENNYCRDYINTIGYKNRNRGVISHFVLSEIMINIITKIDYDDYLKGKILREECFENISETIIRLKYKKLLDILKITSKILDKELYDKLIKSDTKLTEDDALHIIEAIKSNCDFFVTIDKEIIANKKLREYLNQNHNLKIKEL